MRHCSESFAARWREDLLEEARRDLAAARAARRWSLPEEDLRPSAVNGLMPDPEDEEGSWQ
jgi:hypothetical protein